MCKILPQNVQGIAQKTTLGEGPNVVKLPFLCAFCGKYFTNERHNYYHIKKKWRKLR